MELLLINHPLDCPVCDKGGECPLQNQAMTNGRAGVRFDDVKRTFPKPINISSQVLLDRERCVLCARCTRFSDQIAGDPFIALVERGAMQQVGIYEDQPFESYFSGNTVQICPVGALTGAAYRFRSRPFDLVSTPSTPASTAPAGAPSAPTTAAAPCCAGWPSTTPRSTRSGTATRAAGPSPTPRRTGSTYPLVRDRTASCGRRLARGARRAAAGCARRRCRRAHRRPVSAEDAYAYGKFARVVLGHQRHRLPRPAALGEEAEFLAAHVSWRPARRWARSPTPTSGPPRRPPRRLRARGGVADRLPAPAQGVPQGQDAVTPWRPSPRAGWTKLGGALIPRPGHRDRGCRAGRRRPSSMPSPVAGIPRRASGWPPRPARWPPPCPPTGPGPAGLDPAPGRRARCAGGRRLGDPAARWPPGDRRRSARPRSPAPGASIAAHRRAATPPASSLRPPAASGAGRRRGRPGDLALPQAPTRWSQGLRRQPRGPRVASRRSPMWSCRSPARREGRQLRQLGGPRAAFEAALSTNAMSDHRVLDLLAAELGIFLETRTLGQIRPVRGAGSVDRAGRRPRPRTEPTHTTTWRRDVVLATWHAAARPRPHAGRRALPGRHRASAAWPASAVRRRAAGRRR
jgi:NADH-quinone oxidoreductase subunit G